MRFQIVDAFLPGPEELIQGALAGIVEGTVVEFSDSGSRARYFAIVEVAGTRRVVVPVEKLCPAIDSE